MLWNASYFGSNYLVLFYAFTDTAELPSTVLDRSHYVEEDTWNHDESNFVENKKFDNAKNVAAFTSHHVEQRR